MTNLIVFGCSFTSYGWPTWSDIIALDRPDWRYENWALSGVGNQAIARRVLYRHHSMGWTEHDRVCIQWSSWAREDRFQRNQWHMLGSVFNSRHYGKAWTEKYWDSDNDVINTVQAQKTTQLLLGSRIAHEMQFYDMGSNYINTAADSRLYDFWKAHLDQYPLVSPGPFLEGLTGDAHPDPLYWLNWVEQQIYPQWNMQLKAETRQRVEEYQQWLVDLARKGWSQDQICSRSNQRMQEEGWRTNKLMPESRHPYTNELILM